MGDDPNHAPRKFPYEVLAAEGGALKYKKTRTYGSGPLVREYEVGRKKLSTRFFEKLRNSA